MPSRPTHGQPTHGRPTHGQPARGQATRLAFAPDEWELLTRLPARVMIAATSAEPASAARTVAEGIAGLDAIAAGGGSDSSLVRAVVGTIYTEADRDDEVPAAQELTDRAAGLAGVLAACRTAAVLLRTRAGPVDSAAYRQWLRTIAARVCGAPRGDGPPSNGGSRTSPAEQRFLDDLGTALG